MSTTSTALITAEELMQFPDDDLRHELINGELITKFESSMRALPPSLILM